MMILQDHTLLLISLVWVVIWFVFYFGGTRTSTHPVHPQLQSYSILTFVLIFVFYTILHTQGATLASDAQTYASMALVLIGGILMITARIKMRTLTALEILTAKNTQYSEDGIYTHLQHPMYAGIIAILFGSLCLYPGLPAFLLILVICYCIHKKIELE
ncbi:MAG: protein-S-isoprenylcysteine O-methyltransferase Ste14 [Patiriisocius sp.]|jgi:protein-S-isoprenylcysteine O-methyltransferase Ste14